MIPIKGETPEQKAIREAEELRKKSGTSGASKEVNWTKTGTGEYRPDITTTETKSLTDAKNYMNPSVPEYSWLVESYNKVRSAGLTTSRSPLTWWAKVVDQAAASDGLTPWEIARSYQGDLPGTTDTTGGLTKAEQAKRLEMQRVVKALNQNPEAELTGDAGELQDMLTKYSDYMGLMKSRKEINSYVRSVMEQGTNPDVLADNLREQAMTLYPNFSERLKADPELTVRDLVNPYLEVMSDTLELDPNMIKITDPTIQSAINGTKLRSLNDFRMDMRNDTRFATTRTAKREAIDFAQSLLKGFGFSI